MIALMGGSYNPVHIGHMIVASCVAQWCEGVEQTWMLLSPQNPLKSSGCALAGDMHRLEMLRMACAGSGLLDVCDVELSMPCPNYTIDTLHRLKRMYPGKDFRLVIGADNWAIIDKWRSYEEIIRDFGLIVYPRPGYPIPEIPEKWAGCVTVVPAPTVEISSTWLRDSIARGMDVNYFLPNGVYHYINEHNLYACGHAGT